MGVGVVVDQIVKPLKIDAERIAVAHHRHVVEDVQARPPTRP